MARVTIEDCLKNVENRFQLVHLAAKRVRQVREGGDFLIKSKNKDVVTALREIAAKRVNVKKRMKKARNKKKINHAVGKAIFDHNMIINNDNILVCVSGGKDSLALLNILFSFRKKAPVDFNLFPVYIDLGFENSFAKELKEYVNKHYGSIRIEYTDYGEYAHSEKNRENPCFCAPD